MLYSILEDKIKGNAYHYNGNEYGSYEDVKKIVARPERIHYDRVEALGGKIVVYLKDSQVKENDLAADWVKDHMAKYGVEPGFF